MDDPLSDAAGLVLLSAVAWACRVHVGWTSVYGCEEPLRWMILAHDNDGRIWTTCHRHLFCAAYELGTLLGIAWEDG